ncbi:MalY/PatB family protein [Marinobacter zhanjiangensis]|uniref:cysteine-S-conjugate beta-lyase n=1 Tax=Marinobacter zhanjiangensis TaxID=578215 RepID=A0ABQ3BAF6_9GAMM|nr:PatB family C-S lyase [Marinobacter zhanjiangensis]GGY86052.1 cystathionine beta-lyase [Marinobacter zhanjiangensis]
MNFDQSFSRENTCAVKFDARKAVFGREDVIPLWVADTDFAAPEVVTEALVSRARHPAYGYTLFPDSLYEAMIDWFRDHHQWTIRRDWIRMAPGVVPSLHAAAMAFASEGEGVIIQPPVYPPFFSSIRKAGRRVVENPLVERDGGYQMDLEHLTDCAADPSVKVLFLCSPHNPVGRVWSTAELEAVLEIARAHDVVVISDEIHADLVYPDRPGHRMLATLSRPDDPLLTTVAPSKTFNIPGMGLSAVVSERQDLLRQLNDVFDSLHMVQCNPFSITAFEAGYRYGADWVAAMMDYVRGNRDFVLGFVEQQLPEIRVTDPEGTYLLWLDCRALGLDDAELKRFMVEQAGVGMNPGISFGSQGSGFMRLNLGSPLAVIQQAMAQIEVAVAARR